MTTKSPQKPQGVVGQPTDTHDIDRLSDALLAEIEAGCAGVQGGPWKLDQFACYVWAPSEKGGDFPLMDEPGKNGRVVEMRGWGYYTGQGSGALGLSYEEARAHQQRTGEHVARLDPATILSLIHEILEARTARGAVQPVTEEMVKAALETWWHDERAQKTETGIGKVRMAEAAMRLVLEQFASTALSSPAPSVEGCFDFREHLQRQREWSGRTFGPDARTMGVVDHIRKELAEIEADPTDVKEWIDVVILGLDGAWRAGYSPEAIIEALVAKQTRNEGRVWPDWRTQPTDKAIEHTNKGDDAAPASGDSL